MRPVAVDDAYSTAEDTALVLTQANLKGNDTDVDNANAELSVTAVNNATKWIGSARERYGDVHPVSGLCRDSRF